MNGRPRWGLATTLGVGTFLALGCGRVGYDELIGLAADGYQLEAGAADRVGDLGRDPGDGSADLGRDRGDEATQARTDDAAASTDAEARTDAGASTDAEGSSVADAGIERSCPNATQCALRAALVHRYSFDGTGTLVTDSVGAAHGTAIGAQLNGSGALVLAGGNTDQYVDLPKGIIHSLTDATLEVWLIWPGRGAGWQRIFDFGSSDAPVGSRGGAVDTLYLTPAGGGPGGLIGAFKTADQPSEAHASSGQILEATAMAHVALVIDHTNRQMIVYRNGQFDASVDIVVALSALNDVNNWLGRSQYAIDESLTGALCEFRIYNAALSAAMLRESFVAGPDAPLLD